MINPIVSSKNHFSNQQGEQNSKLKKACEDFEAVFLNMMWNLSKSDSNEKLFNGGTGEHMFKSVLHEEYSSRMSKTGQTGLSDLIYRDLSKQINFDEKSVLDVNTDHIKRNKSIRIYQNEKNTPHLPLNSFEKKLVPYISYIKSAAVKYNLPEDIIGAVILTESGGDSKAVSPKKAMGLMQIMPKTGKELGLKNPFSPRDNIDKGAKYLAKLSEQFNGNSDLVLAAYNAGPGNVKKYGGIPPFKETIRYVEKVNSLKEKLRFSLMK